MEEKEAKVFKAYLSKRKKLKIIVEELLSKLGHDEIELKAYIQFAAQNKKNHDLIESNAASMVLDILTELNFPDSWEDYDDLIFLHLKEWGWEIEDEERGEGDSWHDLVDDNNGFTSIALSNGSDLIVIDTNNDNHRVRVADHSCHITRAENVEEIYSEHFELWFDDKTNTYVNKNNLLLNKVFDKDGNFDLDSEYITEFFEEELTNSDVNYYMFANYIITKTEQEYLNLFEIE